MLDVFFLSYARLDNDDKKLKYAVDEITRRVERKIGGAATIFFDTTDLKNGVQWQKLMAKALQETPLIVCFCSPAYMKSAFCAKEFEVFRRRFDEADLEIVAIFPVIWEPGTLPAAINRFHQPKDPRFPSDYYSAGLYQLSRLKSQEDNFITAIEVVANDIDAADKGKKLPPWKKAVQYDDLPNFPHNPKAGTYGVALTVLHDEKSQWKPGNVRPNVGELVDSVSASLRISWEDVPADAVTFAAQLAKAEKERHASIIVVERDDAAKAPWTQMLSALDQGGHKNVAVLVGWKESDVAAPAEIKETIQKLLPNSSGAGAPHNYFPLDDELAFKNALTQTITTLQMAMVAQDTPAKAQSQQLRDGAVSTGVPIDSMATLPVPGSQP